MCEGNGLGTSKKALTKCGYLVFQVQYFTKSSASGVFAAVSPLYTLVSFSKCTHILLMIS